MKPPSGSGCGPIALELTHANRLIPAACMPAMMLATPSEKTVIGVLAKGTPRAARRGRGGGGAAGEGDDIGALVERQPGEEPPGRAIGTEHGKLHRFVLST